MLAFEQYVEALDVGEGTFAGNRFNGQVGLLEQSARLFKSSIGYLPMNRHAPGLLEPDFQRPAGYGACRDHILDADGFRVMRTDELHSAGDNRIAFQYDCRTLPLHHFLRGYEQGVLVVEGPWRIHFEQFIHQRCGAVPDGCAIEADAGEARVAQRAQQVLVVHTKQGDVRRYLPRDIATVRKDLHPRGIVAAEQCGGTRQLLQPTVQYRCLVALLPPGEAAFETGDPIDRDSGSFGEPQQALAGPMHLGNTAVGERAGSQTAHILACPTPGGEIVVLDSVDRLSGMGSRDVDDGNPHGGVAVGIILALYPCDDRIALVLAREAQWTQTSSRAPQRPVTLALGIFDNAARDSGIE